MYRDRQQLPGSVQETPARQGAARVGWEPPTEHAGTLVLLLRNVGVAGAIQQQPHGNITVLPAKGLCEELMLRPCAWGAA